MQVFYMHLPPLVVFRFCYIEYFFATKCMNSLICTTVYALTYQATQLSLSTLGLWHKLNY